MRLEASASVVALASTTNTAPPSRRLRTRVIAVRRYIEAPTSVAAPGKGAMLWAGYVGSRTSCEAPPKSSRSSPDPLFGGCAPPAWHPRAHSWDSEAHARRHSIQLRHGRRGPAAGRPRGRRPRPSRGPHRGARGDVRPALRRRRGLTARRLLLEPL